jgi:hypothetical protein
VVALITACGTRIATGSRIEGVAQLCFFTAMAAVGTATFVCQHLEAAWCWSAITLVAMVITVVFDFRRMSEPTHGTVVSR